MKSLNSPWLMAAALLLTSGSLLHGQQPASPLPAHTPAASIDGVRGVKQDAVESIKKVEPGTVNPAAVTTAAGVNKVDGVNTVNGVKAPGHEAVQPVPPTPAGSAAPVGAVSNIRAVQGVQGILPPKQQNLEAALMMKEGGGGTPAGGGAEHGGKGKAAAAALLGAPPEKAPVKTGPLQDGRGGFQEFEKLTTPGS